MGGGAQLWNPTPPPPLPSPQLNASDDRGIDIVRGPILSFASTRTIFKWVGGTEVGGEEQDAGGRDKEKQMRTAVQGQRGSTDAGPKGKSVHRVLPHWEEASPCAINPQPCSLREAAGSKAPSSRSVPGKASSSSSWMKLMP